MRYLKKQMLINLVVEILEFEVFNIWMKNLLKYIIKGSTNFILTVCLNTSNYFLLLYSSILYLISTLIKLQISIL